MADDWAFRTPSVLADAARENQRVRAEYPSAKINPGVLMRGEELVGLLEHALAVRRASQAQHALPPAEVVRYLAWDPAADERPVE